MQRHCNLIVCGAVRDKENLPMCQCRQDGGSHCDGQKVRWGYGFHLVFSPLCGSGLCVFSCTPRVRSSASTSGNFFSMAYASAVLLKPSGAFGSVTPFSRSHFVIGRWPSRAAAVSAFVGNVRRF